MGKKTSAAKTGIFAAIIGAIAGILFAPKSGKETRKDLKDAAIKANREAEKKLKNLHAELKEKSDEASVELDKLKGKTREELADLAKRAEFAREKASELIAAVRDFEADDDEVEKAIKDGKDIVKQLDAKITPKKTVSKAKKPAAKTAAKKTTKKTAKKPAKK